MHHNTGCSTTNVSKCSLHTNHSVSPYNFQIFTLDIASTALVSGTRSKQRKNLFRRPCISPACCTYEMGKSPHKSNLARRAPKKSRSPVVFLKANIHKAKHSRNPTIKVSVQKSIVSSRRVNMFSMLSSHKTKPLLPPFPHLQTQRKKRPHGGGDCSDAHSHQ